MKIALLTNGVFPYIVGGMQKHSFYLAKYLVKFGVEVVLYHFVPRGKEDIKLPFSSDEMKRLRMVEIDYPNKGVLPGHYLRENSRYSNAILEKYLKDDQCVDFIYAQGLTGQAFIKAKRSGVDLPPIGINSHGYEMFQCAFGVKARLQQYMLRPVFAEITKRADFVFSFAGKIREIVNYKLGVSDHRIIEIPNAIDKSWLKDIPTEKKDRLRFVFVGRYERRKGIEELHKVIGLLDPEACEFHFIGPIPKSLQIKQQNVCYYGKISEVCEIWEVLDRCDALVCPSYAEGMPTVILEAMARGLFVIATDVGATSSMVSARNGILMSEPGVECLLQALKNAIDMDDQIIAELKENSLNLATMFTWDRVANSIIHAIEEHIR